MTTDRKEVNEALPCLNFNNTEFAYPVYINIVQENCN